MHGELHPFLQEALERSSMKLGLERMQEMERRLGSPTAHFATIHVAGTNGKGSVSTKIAKGLELAGKKVGLYTSPHLFTYHERICINGKPIPEERVDLLFRKIDAMTQEPLSYFELLTLLAFCYFAEEKVEVAVLETGLGGRLDATNVVTPVLSVVTSIAKDHTAYLGETLEEIAGEKAGIFKPHVPALLGPCAHPWPVFEQVACALQAPLFGVEGCFAHYEEENRAVARRALELLPWQIDESVIEKGIEAVPLCRFQKVGENPLVILDVAHNPDGLERTFQRLHFTYPQLPCVVLAGFSADKDIEGSLRVIHRHSDAVFLTHTSHSRLAKLGDPVFERAYAKAYQEAERRGAVLLVCGSFFLMKAARDSILTGYSRTDL